MKTSKNNVEDFTVILNSLQALRAFTKVKLTTILQLHPVNHQAVKVLQEYLTQLDIMLDTYDKYLK